jgi:hypothetical protein
MKSTYTAPKLTSLGNVTNITQVLGNPTSQDFVYLNGSVISNNNDIDSIDLVCTGSAPNLNCTEQ